ncbi:hypothetical protein FRC02_001215 [Tulasnella sp. 418]|nr:hypothetical protein FRC02_001215 [Tulasnella sp. 418]
MSTSKPDKPEQVFRVHRASVLDANWIDSTTFVSCSVDKLIHICRLGSTEPIRTFAGHEDEVNLVRLSKDKSLLASSSDDRTVRVWDLTIWKEEGADAQKVYPPGVVDRVLKGVLRGHDREIGSLGWCPNPDGNEYILVTTSFDRSVRVWDTNTGTCLRELRDHDDRVFTHSFSSKGTYLATGAGDGKVLVYELSSGKRVFEWHCNAGGIFEIDWQKTGNKIGLCLENKGVAVLDMERFGLIDYRPPASS